MQEHPEMRVEPSEADLAAAKVVGEAMIAAIPKGTSSSIIIGALGIVMQTAFISFIKKEFVVQAFEDFSFFTRRKIVEEVRRGRH